MTESAPGVPDDDVFDLAAQLRVTIGSLVRKFKQIHADGGLTMSETATLSQLDRGGPATSSELARRDKISPQSMGSTISALEQRGLIARDRDPADGRRVVLSLTDAGRRVIRDRRGARTELIARALDGGFTGDELEQLRAAAPLLQRLAEKL
ncbi:MAG TPA: MarR family transcriptional regulator [Trebonia sp.]|jgi:DNA-binding MarR family transcriptional regulator